MPPGPQMSTDDRRLAGAVATTLDAVADVLAGCVDGRPSAGPDLQVLVAARHRHRQILDATTRAAVAGSTPATVVVAAIEAVFPTRVLSFVALAMAADAIVLTGRTARVVGDDFGMVEPIAAEDTLRHDVALDLLGPAHDALGPRVEVVPEPLRLPAEEHLGAEQVHRRVVQVLLDPTLQQLVDRVLLRLRLVFEHCPTLSPLGQG